MPKYYFSSSSLGSQGWLTGKPELLLEGNPVGGDFDEKRYLYNY